MNRENMKQILIDQKEMYINNSFVYRDYELEDNINYCFVGIRRTGKSYMMFQQIKKLMDDGFPLEQIVYEICQNTRDFSRECSGIFFVYKKYEIVKYMV